jgi:hypothetical protein
MGQTIEGAKLAKLTMIEKYGGLDGYKKAMSTIASKGGSVKGVEKGFKKRLVCTDLNCSFDEINHRISQCAGQRGGTISKRKPKATIR